MVAITERVDSPMQRPPRAGAAGPALAPRAARLELRAMTGWEEELVERHQSDPNTARLCNEVLARCLVPAGQDPGDERARVRALLVAERDRELVALRRLSLGPDVRAEVTCPSCAGVSDAEFSLDDLHLDLDLPPAELTLDLAELGAVQLRLPTAGDQEDLIDAELDTEAERLTWLLARCVRLPGADAGAAPDRLDLDGARDLPIGARQVIAAALQDALPDLDLEMAVECSHCGSAFDAPFDVASFFFSN